MTSRKMFTLAASVFVFALTWMPSAHADCGLAAKAARPTSWHPEAGAAAFVPAEYEGPSIVGMWHVTFTSKGSGSALPSGTPVDDVESDMEFGRLSFTRNPSMVRVSRRA